jgi:two-component system response regulator YesN
MYKILVVDDNKIERNGIVTQIKKLDIPCETVEAQNGRKALSYLEENKVDILITDIRMPFMNGLELVARAKMLYPEIHLVIFSAYSDFSYAQQAIANKVDCYLLKPIDLSEFSKALTSIIDDLNRTRQFHSEEMAIVENMITFNTPAHSSHRNTNANDIPILIDGIFASIENKDIDGISDSVDNLLIKMQECNVASMLYVKQVIIEIIKKLCMHLPDNDKSNVIEHIKRISVYGDLDEIRSFVKSLIDSICQKICEEDEKTSNFIIDFAIDYISQKYMTDISLESIAEELNISAGYFSRTFKREVGQGFVRYLTMYRIERAKELLTKTNMKIKDISNSVGIADISYFGYIFKKYTNLTPNEYRNKYR